MTNATRLYAANDNSGQRSAGLSPTKKLNRLLIFTGALTTVLIASHGRLIAAPSKVSTVAPEGHSANDAPKIYTGRDWHISRPPYPFAARAKHEQGSMNVVILTGRDGRVVKASVPKSTTHPTLDLFTATWAYVKWYGPPNQKAIVPITYILE